MHIVKECKIAPKFDLTDGEWSEWEMKAREQLMESFKNFTVREIEFCITRNHPHCWPGAIARAELTDGEWKKYNDWIAFTGHKRLYSSTPQE